LAANLLIGGRRPTIVDVKKLVPVKRTAGKGTKRAITTVTDKPIASKRARRGAAKQTRPSVVVDRVGGLVTLSPSALPPDRNVSSLRIGARVPNDCKLTCFVCNPILLILEIQSVQGSNGEKVAVRSPPGGGEEREKRARSPVYGLRDAFTAGWVLWARTRGPHLPDLTGTR
jgi:hypothetical protein